MSVMQRNMVERSTLQPANTLRLKVPPTEEQQKWVEAEIDDYVTATQYLAWFFEMRSRLGDMTEQEVFDEIKSNISMHARGGFDMLGVQ